MLFHDFGNICVVKAKIKFIPFQDKQTFEDYSNLCIIPLKFSSWVSLIKTLNLLKMKRQGKAQCHIQAQVAIEVKDESAKLAKRFVSTHK